MAEFVDAETAASLIQDGDAVLFGGSGGGHAVPEAVIEALARRFLEDGAPRDLTLISVVSLGDWQATGFNLLAEPGLARRVISAGFNNCPKIAALALADRIEAWTLPQGTLSQLMRDMAAGPAGPAHDDRAPHLRRPAPRRRPAERRAARGPGRAARPSAARSTCSTRPCRWTSR